ncbi:MAG TPA: hypothetical protein VM183_16930, partial [Burkholderiales bacterium]|nr:hypothetical protein [Burkholderiales bacterium]
MNRVAGFFLAVVVAGCATVNTLVPGQSTLRDVEQVLGQPADKRLGQQGETVYWYPQHPYGRASYAARIAPDGHLVGLEQRLTEENTLKVVKGMTAGEVYDLLGPPYQPEVYPRMQREAWTYPMRVQGYGYPKWFVVYLSTGDRTVQQTDLMDDPTAVPRNGRGRR